MIFRYTLRHIRRTPLPSLLTFAVALCFLVALGWMNGTMARNEAEVERLYTTTQVNAKVVRGPTFDAGIAYQSGGAFIRARDVDKVMESGFVRSAYLEAGSSMRVVPLDEEGKPVHKRGIKDIWARGFERPEVFFQSDEGKYCRVEYATGWDETLFAAHERVVILPDGVAAQLGLELGQDIMLTTSDGRSRGNFVVAGRYSGSVSISASGHVILLPLGTMGEVEGYELSYAAAQFELDPAKNREMPQLRTLADHINAMSGQSKFLIQDEVLREVVEPLEKNLSLMAVLYPVTIGVSVLIALGLALLLQFQCAREAAILRVLGTPRAKTRLMLGAGQALLCALGLLLGLAVTCLLRREVGAVLRGPILLCAGLYFLGSLCGTWMGAVSVTRNKALELLQVKE